MPPVVSVILTSYNKPLTIDKAIESVIRQTFKDWELFIMDDNSNNETVSVINRFLNDTRIHYFNSNIPDSERYKTTRYASLINEAILKSNGKYITYLTDDNLYLPDRFETMVNVLNQNPTIDIVYSQQLVRWIDENGKVYKEGVRKARKILLNPVGLVDHCSVMHTRRIAEEVNKFYSSYWDDNPSNWLYGDAVFWIRLTKFKPFYPIRKTLDIAYKTPESFQRLYTHLPNKIPNGTLIKGLLPDIFIIENHKRRKISPEAFDKLNYLRTQIVSVPDPFLYKYDEGNPVDNKVFENLELMPSHKLLKPHLNPSVYFIQNKKKHLIRNEKAFLNYKFQRQQIITVNDIFLSQLPDGPPIEELANVTTFIPDRVLFHCQSTYYLSLDNILHPIDRHVAIKLNLPVTDPVQIDTAFLNKFKQGESFSW